MTARGGAGGGVGSGHRGDHVAAATALASVGAASATSPYDLKSPAFKKGQCDHPRTFLKTRPRHRYSCGSQACVRDPRVIPVAQAAGLRALHARRPCCSCDPRARPRGRGRTPGARTWRAHPGPRTAAASCVQAPRRRARLIPRPGSRRPGERSPERSMPRLAPRAGALRSRAAGAAGRLLPFAPVGAARRCGPARARGGSPFPGRRRGAVWGRGHCQREAAGGDRCGFHAAAALGLAKDGLAVGAALRQQV